MPEFQITKAEWTANGMPDNLSLSDTGVISGVLDEAYTGIYSAVETAVTTNYGTASGIIHIFGTNEVLWIDEQDIVLYESDTSLEANTVYVSGGYIHVNRDRPVITSLSNYTVPAGTTFQYQIKTLIYDPDETYSLFSPETDEGATVAVIYRLTGEVSTTAILKKETGIVTVRLPDMYETQTLYFDVYVTNDQGTSTKRIILTVLPNLQAPVLSLVFPSFIRIGSTITHQFTVWNPLPGNTFSVLPVEGYEATISGLAVDEETGMAVWHVPDTGVADFTTQYAKFNVQVADRNGCTTVIDYITRFIIPDRYKPVIDDQELVFDSGNPAMLQYATGHAIHVQSLDLSKVITSTAQTSAVVGQRFEYQITTVGNLPTFTYEVVAQVNMSVDNLQVDSKTGLVVWDVPATLPVDTTAKMLIKVRDELNKVYSQYVSIHVVATQDITDQLVLSPVFPAYAVIGSTLTYPLTVLKADPSITYSVTSETEGLSVDSETGLVTWHVPDTGLTTFVGQSAKFGVTATNDKGESSTQSYTSGFIIPERYWPVIDEGQVFAVDSAKANANFYLSGVNILVTLQRWESAITSPRTTFATPGHHFEYQITTVGATQGRTYSLTVPSVYEGDIQVDSETGLVTWDVPSTLPTTTVNITVRVIEEDGSYVALSVSIYVVATQDITDQLVLSPVFPAYAVIGSTITYPLTVLKADPSVTFSVAASTPGLTVDSETGLVTWHVPDTGLATFVNASVMFSLTATNAKGESSTQSYTSGFIIPERYWPVIEKDQVFEFDERCLYMPRYLAGSNIHVSDLAYPLLFTSPYIAYALKGERFEYQFTTAGNVPNCTYSIIDISAKDAEVEINSETGLLTWDVPVDFTYTYIYVTVSVADNDGQVYEGDVRVYVFPDALASE